MIAWLLRRRARRAASLEAARRLECHLRACGYERRP